MSAVRIRGGRSSQTTRPRMAKCKCQPSTDSKGVVHCCDSKNSKGGSKCECAKAGRSCNYTWCFHPWHRCLCYTPLSAYLTQVSATDRCTDLPSPASPVSHYCKFDCLMWLTVLSRVVAAWETLDSREPAAIPPSNLRTNSGQRGSKLSQAAATAWAVHLPTQLLFQRRQIRPPIQIELCLH